MIPNLETLYQVKIGRKECQLFCLKNEIRRMKRKLALIQAGLNRGEKPDPGKIDAQDPFSALGEKSLKTPLAM